MQLNVGSVYEGKVTGITKFGAFVELEKGTTGLVHISEIAKDFVNDINDFVKIGDSVKVKLLSVDGNKISLSIKRADESESSPRRRPEGSDRSARRSRPPVFDGIKKPKNDGPMSFEDMIAKYKQSSDEKFSDLKRKNGDMRPSSRRGK